MQETDKPSINKNQPRYQVQEVISEGLEGGVDKTDSVATQREGVEIPFIQKRKRPAIVFILLAISILAILFSIALKLKPKNPTLFGTPGEIVWWGIQHDESVYKPLIEEYQRQNPNIKIIYKKQSLARNEGPDIFEIHSSWPYMFKNELAPLPSSVMSQEEYDKMFYPVILSALKIGKEAIAMPLEYDALTLFINEDIFTSALKKPPVTWDDLKKLASTGSEGLTIKEKGSNRIIQSGVALGFTENVDYWPEVLMLLFYQNRVNPAKPDTSNAFMVFSFLKEFRNLGSWDAILPPSTIAFSRGNVAMFFGPSRVAKDIAKENPNLKFRTVLLPQLPKNSPSDPDFSYATFWSQAVWVRSRNKDVAWDFLKFLVQRESLEKINKNIKDSEGFARAYPRPEMNIQFKDDSILGSVVSLALAAKHWYVADKTNDGKTGLNSQLSSAFGEVIEVGASRESLNKLTSDVQTILSKYSIPTR